MKDLCQKRKVKLIFRGAYRLSGTGIVECLEIIDVGCNLKQFDALTRLTLTPIFYEIGEGGARRPCHGILYFFHTLMHEERLPLHI